MAIPKSAVFKQLEDGNVNEALRLSATDPDLATAVKDKDGHPENAWLKTIAASLMLIQFRMGEARKCMNPYYTERPLPPAHDSPLRRLEIKGELHLAGSICEVQAHLRYRERGYADAHAWAEEAIRLLSDAKERVPQGLEQDQIEVGRLWALVRRSQSQWRDNQTPVADLSTILDSIRRLGNRQRGLTKNIEAYVQSFYSLILWSHGETSEARARSYEALYLYNEGGPLALRDDVRQGVTELCASRILSSSVKPGMTSEALRFAVKAEENFKKQVHHLRWLCYVQRAAIHVRAGDVDSAERELRLLRGKGLTEGTKAERAMVECWIADRKEDYVSATKAAASLTSLTSNGKLPRRLEIDAKLQTARLLPLPSKLEERLGLLHDAQDSARRLRRRNLEALACIELAETYKNTNGPNHDLQAIPWWARAEMLASKSDSSWLHHRLGQVRVLVGEQSRYTFVCDTLNASHATALLEAELFYLHLDTLLREKVIERGAAIDAAALRTGISSGTARTHWAHDPIKYLTAVYSREVEDGTEDTPVDATESIREQRDRKRKENTSEAMERAARDIDRLIRRYPEAAKRLQEARDESLKRKSGKKSVAPGAQSSHQP
jgi:hypothetical protein